MIEIRLDSVNVDVPVLNASSRSLKTKLMRMGTGGKIAGNADGSITVHALKNINLHVKPGDRVGLIGRNGSGKTTLLRLLAGVYSPTVGTASVLGNVASLIDMSVGIHPEATGRENIIIRSALIGQSKRQTLASMDSIIELAGLGDFIDLPVRTYSSGMQLKLTFAISVLIRPQILLMDEWLSVGDEDFRQEADRRMEALIDNTSILVIASHSENLVKQTCNRTVLLENGKIILDGSTDVVCAEYFSSKK